MQTGNEKIGLGLYTMLGNCLDCKHYKAPELKAVFPQHVYSPRSCEIGNEQALSNWWETNKHKRNEARTFCSCFQPEPLSVSLFELTLSVEFMSKALAQETPEKV